MFALDKIREIMNNIETSVLECLNDIEELADILETSEKNTTVFLQRCKLLPRLNELYSETEETYQDAAIHSIERGIAIDHMSGILYLASVYLNEGYVAIANKMVLEVLKVGNVLVYAGRCSEKRSIQLTMEGIPEQRQNLRNKKEKKMPHAFDVVISPNDIHCVPIPVGYECYVTQLNQEKKKYNDTILFHPCVYKQFLLCFGYYKIGNRKEFENVLEQLQSTIENSKDGYQRYRALNLLGNCYYLSGNYQQAFSCFQELISLADNRVQNAAIYHMCIMLMHILAVFEQISREIKIY
ncbi:unnamed protein product [Mytilus coruscus]|uniref:Uncharacterized protein n=1 Tax=Mytilus coruscus TaxID=42192 RepID=A0A6J8EFU1_MYTCO|nr:unnamed protein product [Mytilus coruscus]